MKEATLERTLRRYDHGAHLVFWETTKACALACRHCRASAQPDPGPDELSTAEGFDLLAEIARVDGPKPIVIFTGGDCLARPDLEVLIAYAKGLGLRMGIAPSVTPRLTRERLARIFALGVGSISISLDGALDETHDGIRGIAGHRRQTLEALKLASSMQYRVQVNTAVMRENAYELARIAAELLREGIPIWEVFFLIGTGRGAALMEATPEQCEDICHFLVDVSAYGLTVRTVEAPFFRRVTAERARGGTDWLERRGELYTFLRDELVGLVGEPPGQPKLATLATGDGRGILFVGHDGEIHPSGFLPLAAGNVRHDSLWAVYTESPFFTAIRASQPGGACGTCAYSKLCGGSRARAYARTGDPQGDDPSCLAAREFAGAGDAH